MLTGKKVFLRKLETSDLARCHAWLNEPEIFISMGTFAPRSREDHERWFQGLIGSRTNLVFALCSRDREQHIGNVSLFNVDYLNRNAGLTIFIAEPELRGQGAGREAISLLCEYGFDYLNLHRIYCKTDNPAAARMYEGLGFVREGTLRQQNFHRGRYIDKMLYGLLRTEFRPAHHDDNVKGK